MRADFRNWLFRFGLLFMTATPAFADEVQPITHATPAMWTVHGPRGTAYLLGSVHALPKNVDWQTADIKTAIKRSNAFVFELPMSRDSLSNSALTFSANVLLPSSVSLPSYFDAEMRSEFKAAVEHTQVDPEALVVMRPWYAARELQDAMTGKLHAKAEEGVDFKVYAMADKRGVHDIRALETAEVQISKLKGTATTKNELEILKVAMKEAATKPMFPAKRLLDAWEAGDTNALADIINASQSVEERQAILDDRNKDWVPKIEKMLKEKRTFFITVGAAHLVGPDGVPSLLRQDGYHVTGPDQPEPKS